MGLCLHNYLNFSYFDGFLKSVAKFVIFSSKFLRIKDQLHTTLFLFSDLHEYFWPENDVNLIHHTLPEELASSNF